MRSVISLLLVLVTGCYSSAWSQYRTPAGHQRSQSRSLWPSDLEIPGAHHGEKPIAYKVRIYVDQDYRRSRAWRQNATQLVRWVNGYLVPAFGVGLVPELVEWQRQGDGDHLEEVLAVLAAEDAGGDVDWVIGLTGSLPSVTTRYHELGMGEMLGKHLVFRAYNDTAELAALEEHFGLLEAKEREALYKARHHHKEITVFLHELGHTLGAVHERGDGRIMGPSWAPEASTFSEVGAQVIEVGLRLRRVRGTDNQADAERAKLRAEMLALYQIENDEWWADDRERIVAQLASGARSGPPTLGMSDAGVPHMARTTFESARRLFSEGEYAAAWRELAPLVEAYPRHLAIQGLGCRLVAYGVKEGLAACRATAALAPTDAWPLLVVASAHGEGERDQALAALEEADRRLVAAPEGAMNREVAQAFHALGAISAAEKTATRLGADGEELRKTLLQRRRLLGLAPGEKTVPVEREAEYAALFDRALDAVNHEDGLAAAVPLEELREKFPAAPGTLALGCALEASRGKAAAAKKLCGKALAGWEETMLAHFYLAQVEKDAGAQIHHWERVRALDPGQRAAWAALFKLYRAAGRTADLERVQKEYDQRFR